MLSCFIAFILSLLLLFSATRVYLEDDKEFLSNADIVGFCDDYRWESANILNQGSSRYGYIFSAKLTVNEVAF